MGDHSSIQWTEATWNPIVGCTHVSEGCDHCYAARETSGRLSRHPAYAGLAVAGRFTGEVRLLPERLDQPLRWRKPRLIFVNSMSDLFHDGVPDEYVAKVFAVMAESPWHTFQVLTKRPGRMASLLNRPEFPKLVDRAVCEFPDLGYPLRENGWLGEWPLPNVWLGTSVETQKWANVRVPKLVETPAVVRFLSCEPLLGPLELTEWLDPDDPDADCEKCGQEWWARFGGHPVLDEENDDTGEWCPGPMRRHSGLHWIIVGGESGPQHRPMDRKWAQSLLGQAQTGRVAFFFKQWGGRTPKAGGRELDGRTWDEMPTTTGGASGLQPADQEDHP